MRRREDIARMNKRGSKQTSRPEPEPEPERVPDCAPVYNLKENQEYVFCDD
jgi:hypothetical protein